MYRQKLLIQTKNPVRLSVLIFKKSVGHLPSVLNLLRGCVGLLALDYGLLEIPDESRLAPKHVWVDHVDNGEELLEVILEWRAGQHDPALGGELGQ